MSRSIWRSPSWVRRSWGSGTSRGKGSAWYWAPLVRGVEIDARTTKSPAGRGASPQRAGGRAGQPAGPHSNASFAAEVQTNSEAAARLRRLISVNKVSASEPFVGRSSGSGLRGRDLPHERHGKGRDEEGEHDRSECVGEGERRGLSIGKVPGNALLQALVKRSRTHHRGIAPAELHF